MQFGRKAYWIAPILALAIAAKPAPQAAVARGQHLATVLGCKSCHGPGLDGRETFHDPTIAVLYTSNLTRAVPEYSDAALERVIRTGVRPDGSRLWRMAAAPYAALAPEDMRDLIIYLRSLPPTGEAHPRIVMGPRFKRAVDAGRVKPEGVDLDNDLAHPAPVIGPAFARGRYLARTACGGCHSPDLTGAKDPQPGDPPDLTVVGAYNKVQFRALMHTGRGLTDRNLGDMAVASRERFAYLSEKDIDAVHDYLVARAKAR